MARRGSRPADVDIGTRQGRLDAGLRRATGKLQRWGKTNAGGLKRSFDGFTRSLSSITGFAGVATLVQSARQVKEFEDKLVRLQIQSGSSAQSMDAFRGRLRALSSETGVSADDLLAGAAQFVSLTGRMDQASSALEVFARVAAASGAEMSDIAATAAALSQSFQIEPGDMERAFSVLLTQGKAGAIELKELSTLMSKVGSQFPEFGRIGVEGLAELGAELQVVRRGFGSADEAVTGFMGMMTAFSKHSKDFAKYGIEIFNVDADGTKRFKTVAEIVEQISNSKLMKDPAALSKVFGREEGRRAFAQIQQNLAAFRELERAGLESKAVAEDYATFQASSSGRIARSWEAAKNALASVFTPQRIEMFADALEKVARLVAALVDHATAVGVALAAWKISPAVTSLLLGAASGGGIVGGAAGGGRGKKSGGGGALRGVGADILVSGAGIAGGYVGTKLDRATGLSSWLAGEETRSVEDQLRATIDKRKRFESLPAPLRKAAMWDDVRDINLGDTERQLERLESGPGWWQRAAQQGATQRWQLQAAQSAQTVVVRVEVDERGLLRATEATERETARRSGQ